MTRKPKPIDFADQLRAWRERHELSQAQAAAVLGFRNRLYVSHVETRQTTSAFERPFSLLLSLLQDKEFVAALLEKSASERKTA